VQHDPSKTLLALGIGLVVLGAATWIWGAPISRVFKQTYWYGRPSALSWHRITGGALVTLGVYLVVVSLLAGH
jgi:multisubunit Na+/H+ antiporter MnhB subunit